MQTPIEFSSKILRGQSDTTDYSLYRAGIEWDLTEPIVIESAEDFKSAPRWRDRLEPYHHQVKNLITFCRRLPVTLLADDVGLGKTISAGLIMSELISRERISNTLVVCPKLLGPQWQRELKEKFNIAAEIAIGRDLVSMAPENTGAIITTYNTARLYLEKAPEDRFQMLILDEAHKLRNLYGVEKPPQVAKRFRKALEDRRFQFVLMLTATPIQNRLWDLYSLVDLLTVARGHENPFGSEGMFVRKFIADGRDKARELKLDAQEEFRSIVYGYMSRIRRGDANLSFPERFAQMHSVSPTAGELELINVIAKPIQHLNVLVQISILQALTSSPEALSAQLQNMARKGSVPLDLAADVKAIVARMPPSAKLRGLATLIEQLKNEKPDGWRLVVFTSRLETQTTIQNFLESNGLKVGIINGASGPRNQETIARFWATPPDLRVIVSTEAGSEGVNLQIANVLVNYDLPWNPMIVEQRIGRVQRLNSQFAYVSIFNITLQGTFEEYIVGRLMQKLQMASHAIGDIEALLEGAAIGSDEDDLGSSFEERVLKLVLAALAGKDVERDAALTAESIEKAKIELEREQETIDTTLGDADGTEYVGPQAPTLPPISHSMDASQFVLGALKLFGIRLTPQRDGLYLAEGKSSREYIRLEDPSRSDLKSTLYAPGSPAFRRLTARITASGLHLIDDVDEEPIKHCEDLARQWIRDFGATLREAKVLSGTRKFDGNVLLRVRVTVAHDSYERLIEVPYTSESIDEEPTQEALTGPIKLVERPEDVGIDIAKLGEAAQADDAIAEFARFYLERREIEVGAAGSDERKRKKLEEDFTPRLDISMVGLQGTLYRHAQVRARYGFDSEATYESTLTIAPHARVLTNVPEFGFCSESGKAAPKDCLGVCEITGAEVLRHYLAKSEVTGRSALSEFTVVCTLSGKRILKDEAEQSAVSGKLVSHDLLQTSTLSGRRAEPAFFSRCAFTSAQLLSDEVAISEISDRPYRIDQQMRSNVTGKAGHSQEFTVCEETRQPIAKNEAETCDVTGKTVRAGILRRCEITNKRVLPSELECSIVTGQTALKSLFVESNISGLRLLPDEGIRSSKGHYCLRTEAQSCFWSDRLAHPEDIRVCAYSGLPIHSEYASSNTAPHLKALVELLDGVRRSANESQLWPEVELRLHEDIGGKCAVEAAIKSPAGHHLAVCAEVRKLLGIRANHTGFIYSLDDQSILGRVVQGKRQPSGWRRT
jgi:superfamily II DNA or RNA helicase